MTRRSFDDPTSDAARRALLDNRIGRHHPKRHRTRRRSAALAARKRRQLAHLMEQKRRDAARHSAAVRAYWNGEKDEHP